LLHQVCSAPLGALPGTASRAKLLHPADKPVRMVVNTVEARFSANFWLALVASQAVTLNPTPVLSSPIQLVGVALGLKL